MLEYIQNYLLHLALANVKDFLDYIGWEGEAMIGFTNSLGQEIDDCISVTDDEGHALFLIWLLDFDKGTYSGNMCEGHIAPGHHDDFREKYAKSDLSPVGVVRWGLGI